MKICIVTCYKQPDYIRAITLRAAAESLGHEIVVVKNSHLGLLRYPEVAWLLLRARITRRPDLYIATFRAYEILPVARLLTLGKPLIYDEFINAYEWLVLEHQKIPADGLAARIFRRFYRSLVSTADAVMMDTESHVAMSADLLGLPRDRFRAVIVGSDEQTFARRPVQEPVSETDLHVFYYGNMLPLHGLPRVLEAAEELAGQSFRFTIVGGGEPALLACENARAGGANVEHIAWIDYADLPAAISNADVCLAGPFGNTFQSRFVVTGKAYQFLNMAKPVVVGANHESHLFTDRRDALVVAQGSTDSLVEALTWANEYRDKLPAIGEAGRDLFDRELSHRKVEEQLGELLARWV